MPRRFLRIANWGAVEAETGPTTAQVIQRLVRSMGDGGDSTVVIRQTASANPNPPGGGDNPFSLPLRLVGKPPPQLIIGYDSTKLWYHGVQSDGTYRLQSRNDDVFLLQPVEGHTANYFEIKDASGTRLYEVDVTGKIGVQDPVMNAWLNLKNPAASEADIVDLGPSAWLDANDPLGDGTAPSGISDATDVNSLSTGYWADKSGNEYHCDSSNGAGAMPRWYKTAGSSPQASELPNSLPYVSTKLGGVGSNNNMSPTLVLGDFTIYCIMWMENSTAATTIVGGEGASGAGQIASQVRVQDGIPDAGTVSYVQYKDQNEVGTFRSTWETGSEFPTGAWRRVKFMRNGTTVTHEIDGTTVTKDTGASSNEGQPLWLNEWFQYSTDNGSAENPSEGFFAEFLIFDTALETADQEKVESYLDAKWQTNNGGSGGGSSAPFIQLSDSGDNILAEFAETGHLHIGGEDPLVPLMVTETTEQMRLRYDENDYAQFVVGSTGDLDMTLAGTGPVFVFNDPVFVRGTVEPQLSVGYNEGTDLTLDMDANGDAIVNAPNDLTISTDNPGDISLDAGTDSIIILGDSDMYFRSDSSAAYFGAGDDSNINFDGTRLVVTSGQTLISSSATLPFSVGEWMTGMSIPNNPGGASDLYVQFGHTTANTTVSANVAIKDGNRNPRAKFFVTDDSAGGSTDRTFGIWGSASSNTPSFIVGVGTTERLRINDDGTSDLTTDLLITGSDGLYFSSRTTGAQIKVNGNDLQIIPDVDSDTGILDIQDAVEISGGTSSQPAFEIYTANSSTKPIRVEDSSGNELFEMSQNGEILGPAKTEPFVIKNQNSDFDFTPKNTFHFVQAGTNTGDFMHWIDNGSNVILALDASGDLRRNDAADERYLHEAGQDYDFSATSGVAMAFKDNVTLAFGTSRDATISYDGVNLLMNTQNVGTGNFQISGGKLIKNSESNPSTQSWEIGDNANTMTFNGTNQTSKIINTNSSSNNIQFRITGSSTTSIFTLRYNRIDVYQDMRFQDSVRAAFGNSDDAVIYYNGSNLVVDPQEGAGSGFLDCYETVRTRKTFRHTADTELTIASGAITITKGWHNVDTEADAASDDLDTINGGTDGDILFLKANNTGRTVVLKHGTGNIYMLSGADISLDNNLKAVCMIYDGAQWLVTA